MNKTMLFTGLTMIAMNVIGVLAFFIGPQLTNISFGKIIAGSVYVIFTVFSFIFAIWGAVSENDRTPNKM